MNLSKFGQNPGKSFDLANFNPDAPSGFSKEKSVSLLSNNLAELEELQYRLYAENKTSLLIVLQGIDTAGKDGTIRNVFSAFNPQGVYVKSFKAPDGQETQHDYLWRIHNSCPTRGAIAIFNRSHYEDVMITRVHKLITEKEAKKRIRHINEFERLLTDEKTIVIKLFLNISKDEQLERLKSRIEDPTRNWKFSSADVDERAHWDKYAEVFSETLSKTNTVYAPWWIIPSNQKWFRNLLVSEIILKSLRDLKLVWPKPESPIDEARRALEGTA